MTRTSHPPSRPMRCLCSARLYLGLLLLLLPVLLGCLRGPDTPQPKTLTFEGAQAYTLKPGDWLPGTDVRYIKKGDAGAEFLIAGQPALKQVADSLNWSGSPAAGVHLDLRLRIVWVTEQSLYTAGTMKVAVSDVTPQPGEVNGKAPLAYQAPVAYGLEAGGTVPGTQLTYVGKAAEGAQFKGADGYPFRQPGDSLRWDGSLRPNVWLRVDLRVVQFDERATRLVGTAHVWVAQ